MSSAFSGRRIRDDRGAAWLFLVGALALHVLDEALTGFLDFYNPLVTQIRSRIGWFPMPAFTFGAWLGGLITLIVVLALMTPAVRRGAPGTRLACWVLSVILFLNGLAHLGGSVYFGRWLPGATSAPLMLAASVFAVRVIAGRSAPAPVSGSHPSEPPP